MHAREVHAHEMHAREVHAYEIHARKVHTYEMNACQVHARQMHARQIKPMRSCHEVYAHETHAYEVIAEEPEMKSVIKDEVLKELQLISSSMIGQLSHIAKKRLVSESGLYQES
jgi:hypothetical protein